MGLSYQNGAGSGSITYAIGGGPQTTEAASATTTSYYDDGVLYSVIVQLQFTDPTQGAAVLMVICNPFTGTGAYSSSTADQTLTLLVGTATAGVGNWGNPSGSSATVSLDVITYAPSSTEVDWTATLMGSGLVWTGSGSQSNLDLKVLTTTLTITPGASGDTASPRRWTAAQLAPPIEAIRERISELKALDQR